jgi:hypothetical protein
VKFFRYYECVLHTNTNPFCPENLSVWRKYVKIRGARYLSGAGNGV